MCKSAHPDTSLSFNRKRKNILLLSTRKSLSTQKRCIRCATEVLTSNFPAHKVRQSFTTHNAIIHMSVSVVSNGSSNQTPPPTISVVSDESSNQIPSPPTRNQLNFLKLRGVPIFQLRKPNQATSKTQISSNSTKTNQDSSRVRANNRSTRKLPKFPDCIVS